MFKRYEWTIMLKVALMFIKSSAWQLSCSQPTRSYTRYWWYR